MKGVSTNCWQSTFEHYFLGTYLGGQLDKSTVFDGFSSLKDVGSTSGDSSSLSSSSSSKSNTCVAGEQHAAIESGCFVPYFCGNSKWYLEPQELRGGALW
eukprot:2833437-Pyramimonas_sp.AAC.2